MRHIVNIVINKINNQFIFYDKEIGIDIAEWFQKENFKDSKNNTVSLVNNGLWVKKHYVRKGMASFLGDYYLNTQIQNTRSYREFYLLNRLHKTLPTCKPIFGWVTRSTFFYTANLITEYIPSVTLESYIRQQKMNEDDWIKIGQLILKLHQENIFHGDLNITNILVKNDSKSEKFYLVDFDKSYLLHKIDKRAKISNLKRLARSLQKNNLFSRSNFKNIINGYDNFNLDMIL